MKELRSKSSRTAILLVIVLLCSVFDVFAADTLSINNKEQTQIEFETYRGETYDKSLDIIIVSTVNPQMDVSLIRILIPDEDDFLTIGDSLVLIPIFDELDIPVDIPEGTAYINFIKLYKEKRRGRLISTNKKTKGIGEIVLVGSDGINNTFEINFSGNGMKIYHVKFVKKGLKLIKNTYKREKQIQINGELTY